MKNTSALSDIQAAFRNAAKSATLSSGKFFKTGAGDYAEHDQFLGVPVPTLRIIAKAHNELSFSDIQQLLQSKINEERFLALIILVNQYQKSDDNTKERIYNFYRKNLRYVNNWNLVDASAHLIVGAHLLNGDKTLLLSLAQSSSMWERRIAIVSTWYFIHNREFEYTIKIATLLLNDEHDLIHKAVGWMLREMGKKNQSILVNFLKQHGKIMPRTMWRYAIEKFSKEERAKFCLI